MELPDDVLAQIKDFSRPITRPDWRHLHRMSGYRFHGDVVKTYNKMNLPVINSFVERYERQDMQYLYHRYAYNDSFIAAIWINHNY